MSELDRETKIDYIITMIRGMYFGVEIGGNGSNVGTLIDLDYKFYDYKGNALRTEREVLEHLFGAGRYESVIFNNPLLVVNNNGVSMKLYPVGEKDYRIGSIEIDQSDLGLAKNFEDLVEKLKDASDEVVEKIFKLLFGCFFRE